MAVRQNAVRKSAFLPDVRHLAAPLLGLLGCFRFWECRSLGGWEVLATKNTKIHKESARQAPSVVQWVMFPYLETGVARMKLQTEGTHDRVVTRGV